MKIIISCNPTVVFKAATKTLISIAEMNCKRLVYSSFMQTLYIVIYASSLHHCQSLYICAGMSESLCNYYGFGFESSCNITTNHGETN